MRWLNNRRNGTEVGWRVRPTAEGLMIGTGRLSSGHKRSSAHAVVVGKGCGAIRGPDLQAGDAAGHTVDEADPIKTADDPRIDVLPQRSPWTRCCRTADAELTA